MVYRQGSQGVLRVQRQSCSRCTGGECGLVCGEKNRMRVRSGQYVPSKNHGASAPRNLRQVGARGGNARAQREEQGAALLRAFESSATRDSLKHGLMPFEIARTRHRIWVPARECGGEVGRAANRTGRLRAGHPVRVVLWCHTRLSTVISPLHTPAPDSDMCPTTVHSP